MMVNNDSTTIYLVFNMENPNLKWMMTGGSPIPGTLHVYLGILGYEHSDLNKRNRSYKCVFPFTLWLFNIAMENGPLIDGLPGFTY
jgi:hypothetical protein